MKKSNFIIIIILCLIFTSFNAHAFYYGGEKSLGLAGAYTAVADDTSAIFMNPAGLSQTRTTLTEIDYQTDEVPDSNLWGISIIDSKTGKVAAGVSYYKLGRDYYPALSDREELFVLALAEQYTPNLSLGFNVKYIKQRNPTRDDMTGDFGAIYRLNPQLKAAAVVKNVSSTKMWQIHKLYTGGLAYRVSPALQLSFDITKDKSTVEEKKIMYSYGAEIFSVKNLTLRGGYKIDKIVDKKFYALNVGYSFSGFSIGYVVMRDEVNSDDVIHNISLKIGK